MTASESVWALVSGLPSGARENRLLMHLQAFIDDSGSEPQSPAFVLAGYITSTARWSRFADEWRDTLNEPPGAAYFKASEAMSLRGEFSLRKGWTDAKRDERVIDLARIIRNHALVSLSATLRHHDWEGTIKKLPTFGPRTIVNEHPYVFLWWIMLRELWLHPTKRGLGKYPCDFIFDEQLGFEEAAVRAWRSMKTIIDEPGLPKEMQQWIGSSPVFKDDKIHLPLQAADLFAWSNRRALTHEANQIKLPEQALDYLVSVPAMHLNVTRDYLIRDAYKALDMAREWIESAKKKAD